MTEPITVDLPRRLEDWISRFSDRPLPVLRASHAVARYLQNDPDTGIADLREGLGRDPALCINLLRAANAQRHKHLDNRTATVDQAMMMLGVQRVLALVQDYPVVEDSLGGAALEGYMTSVSRACHIALQAGHWAELRKDVLPAEIATAALMRPAAELVMWVHAADLLCRIRELGGVSPVMRHEAEYVLLGFTLDEFSASLVQCWRLPQLVLELLVPNRVTGRRTMGLTLATSLTELACLGTGHGEMQKVLSAIGRYLGLNADETLAEVREQAGQAQARCPTGAGGSVSWSALLDESGAGTLSQGEPLVCVIPQPALAQRLTAQCLEGDDGRAMQQLRQKHDMVETIDPTVALALRALHRGHGLSRVIYLRINRDQDTCFPHMALGCQGAPDLPELRLPVLPPSELGNFLATTRPHWLYGDALYELAHSMAPSSPLLMETSACFIAGIRTRERAVGLLYADSHQSGRVLDKTAYSGFCQVVEALGKGLSRMD